MAYSLSAHGPRPRHRTSRAHSLLSDTAFSAASYATPAASPTPTPTPAQPTSANPTPRARTAGTATAANAPEPKHAIYKLPEYWNLPPTHPSPFTGTLEASLDLIQDWAQTWGSEHGVQPIIDTLLKPVDTSTRWNTLLADVLPCPAYPCPRAGEDTTRSRGVLEELLFFVTRTLLPEQVAENRAATARLYERRKNLAMKVVLRYDMLFARKMSWNARDHRVHAVVVHCNVAPTISGQTNGPAEAALGQIVDMDGGGDVEMIDVGSTSYRRRPLMQNVWPTLLLPPPELSKGFTTQGVRERMRHHVTDLDAVLMHTDEEVKRWTNTILIARTASALLMWQWVRGNNEVLEDMDADDWEELDGKADECNWIAD